MSTQPTAERRSKPRVQAAHPLILEWHTEAGEVHRARGATNNIAFGGVYCYLERPLPTGTAVGFDLVFPSDLVNGNPLKVHCTGAVLRSEKAEEAEKGFGVAVSIENAQVLEILEPSVAPGSYRVFARVLPPGEVQAEYPGVRSVVRDLSLAGAFIEDERPLTVGRVFKLRLSSNTMEKEIEAGAVVRRSEPNVGMAVEFIILGQEAKELLQEMVAHGRAWSSEQSAAAAETPSEGRLQRERDAAYLRQRAAELLPGLTVVACDFRAESGTFSLRLREPASRAELLLPLDARWARHGRLEQGCGELDEALRSADQLLELGALLKPETH